MSTVTADARFWDNIAEKYAAKPVSDALAFDRKKAVTRERLRPGDVVLEIGAGTGTLALEMAAHAAHIHALDISAEMVRIANQKKQAQGVANVTFHQGTLDDTPALHAHSFDGIWAYSILHLVNDRPGTLRRIYALMKPGGTFISSNVCLGGGWVPYGALITVMRWFGKAPIVHIYDRATIQREMREAGFVDVEEVDVGGSKNVAFLVAKKPAEPAR